MNILQTICFCLPFFLTIKAQDNFNEEKARAEIEIATLELQDGCENLANSLKSSLIKNKFDEKIKVEENYGELLKVLAKNLYSFEDEVPLDAIRNWTFFVKSGDALLRKEDWSFLVSYDIGIDELMHTATVHCKNNTQDCIYIKKGYENLLEKSHNLTLLKKSWSAWQTLLSRKQNEFPRLLNLIKNAAVENERANVKSYWEMLVDYDGAYEIADNLWEEIKPFYFKLQNFVKLRLFNFYNITKTESEIPVYLLGSNFGNDWSPIAGIVSPHPYLFHLAETYLNKTTIENVYKEAEEMTKKLNLGPLGPDFWKNSLFNMTFCENHVISFCASEHTELLTCDKTSWKSYLDAFEVAIDVTLRNIDYLSLARSNLRYSVIDEAIKGLGPVLALKNMRSKGVWDKRLFLTNDSSTPNSYEMAELLLTALRVLPQLPFYLVADKFRLNALENGNDDLAMTWWKLRKEYGGIEGVFNNETDFLADRSMTSNKPYLNKFLGTILQFQLLEYYQPEWQSNESYIEKIANDETFRTMLNDRSSIEWPSLIINHYSIYDLSANALLNYFAPLNDYLDSAPLHQEIPSTTLEPLQTTKKGQILATMKHKEGRIMYENITEVTQPPMRPIHEHVEENLEGPNPTMENITMYIGIGLLVGVAVLISAIIFKKAAKRKRSNNRRFEA